MHDGGAGPPGSGRGRGAGAARVGDGRPRGRSTCPPTATSCWSSAPRAGSPTTSWTRWSAAGARAVRLGRRCCARRPRRPWRWARSGCSRGPLGASRPTPTEHCPCRRESHVPGLSRLERGLHDTADRADAEAPDHGGAPMPVLADLARRAAHRARRGRRPHRAAARAARRSCSCRRRSARRAPFAARARSATTTTAARRGTGTTSAPASTPAPTSTRRALDHRPGRRGRRRRSRPRGWSRPAAVLDFSARGRGGPRLPARGRPHPGLGGRARPAARRRLAAATAPAGTRASTTQDAFLNADETGPHTPGISVDVRAVAGRGVAGHRPRRRDGRHRRRRGALVRPAVPVPLRTCSAPASTG